MIVLARTGPPLLLQTKRTLHPQHRQKQRAGLRRLERRSTAPDNQSAATTDQIVRLDEDERQLLDSSLEDIDIVDTGLNAPKNYYEMLNLAPESGRSEIRESYRKMQKICHPDLAGEGAAEFCILLNEAYATLSEEETREKYDRQLQIYKEIVLASGFEYTGKSLSRWVGKDPSRDESNQRAVFVDEGTCIGCKNCNHCAAATFMMEEDFGRARVFQQWADSEEDINIAIESCPVDCIYWVDADLLPALEFVMQKVQRRSIAAMANGSARSQDPFQMAQGFINSGAEAAARLSAQGVDMDPMALNGGISAIAAIGRTITKAWARLDTETKIKISFVSVDEN